LSESLTPPLREAWAKWISPETLLSQVYNTAPYLQDLVPAPQSGRLIEMGGTADGFLRVLASWQNIRRPDLHHAEQLQDYFALCLACHHATVATFVPTDVDTKIRGIAWRETSDLEVLKPMMRFALGARGWTEEGISIRSIRGVSGHNGEHWSAIAGGLGRMLELGDTASAEEAQAAIETEIDREQAVFDRAAAERDGERLAGCQTVDQSMGLLRAIPVAVSGHPVVFVDRHVSYLPACVFTYRFGSSGQRCCAGASSIPHRIAAENRLTVVLSAVAPVGRATRRTAPAVLRVS